MSGEATLRLRPAGTVDVVVIGAGHSGLAMSACLAARSIDHVVLERGEVANAWRDERWDSLRLLTPNWQSHLPGYRYAGEDPDGFMTMPNVVDFIATYARVIAAPVLNRTTVRSVRQDDAGYRVVTDRGFWRCHAVVLANGAHGLPVVPGMAASLPQSILSLTPDRYRNPRQLDERGVLIVGASATGVQLADEISQSGRDVTLAVGEHVRMPRSYRGRDIQHWLDAAGILDQGPDDVDDLVRARRVPSPQLIGTPEKRTLDLNALADRGVRSVGRLVGIAGSKAQFSGSLRNHCAMADLKMGRLLTTIDEWIESQDLAPGLPAPERFAATRVEDSPPLGLDLEAERIGTVIWATGFRPDYSWLEVPAFDRKGRLQHDGGVVRTPGLYALGLNLMRRRRSSFICGAESDTRDLSEHLHRYLRSNRIMASTRAIA
jgi:putative flavoprotein involved in K+ transport